MVEGMFTLCRVHLAEYVLKLQKDIVLGAEGYKVDVEADEITFAKRAVEGASRGRTTSRCERLATTQKCAHV
eukprot:625430-Amphidinium_carterae.1